VDAQIKRFLDLIELGDFDALGPLAKLLEERGDSSLATLARSVMELELEPIALEYIPRRADVYYELEVALEEVRQALRTRKINSDLAAAIKTCRPKKRDRLLAALRNTGA
jgi:hypothetical protein